MRICLSAEKLVDFPAINVTTKSLNCVNDINVYISIFI